MATGDCIGGDDLGDRGDRVGGGGMTCMICNGGMATKKTDGIAIAQCTNKFCGRIEVLGPFARSRQTDYDGRWLVNQDNEQRKVARGE